MQYSALILFASLSNRNNTDWIGESETFTKQGQGLFLDLMALAFLVWPGTQQHMLFCLPFFSLKPGCAGEGKKRTVFCSAFTCDNTSCCSLCPLSFNTFQHSPALFRTVLEQLLHCLPPWNSSRIREEMVTQDGTAAGRLTCRNSYHSAKIWIYIKNYENPFTIRKEQPGSSIRTRGRHSWNLSSIYWKRLKFSSHPHLSSTAQVRWVKSWNPSPFMPSVQTSELWSSSL